MPARRNVYLPPQYAVTTHLLGSPVRQLRLAERFVEVEVGGYRRDTLRGEVLTHSDGRTTLVLPKNVTPPTGFQEVLVVPGGRAPAAPVEVANRRVQWLRPELASLSVEDQGAWQAYRQTVIDSWRGEFHFKSERREREELVENGLRPPQLGAVHATLAHWCVTREPGTIVMPTGTGKTETMLALLAAERLDRLLVVVPTDALREQTTSKFLSFGLLKTFGVVGKEAQYPIVGTLRSRPRTAQEAAEFFGCCNVVVTTMAVVGGCREEVQRAIANNCSHLFIDEAHHISAPTWEAFRRAFLAHPILQFTATPFRADRRHVDGKIIFNYPLRKAQDEGYFKPILFRSITAFDPQEADEEIARTAIDQLEQDLRAGLDHIVMARASTIHRSEELHTLYTTIAARHDPVLVHSRQSASDRRAALRRVRDRRTHVVVCVDMFGEGFDLPELKIAALHDVHKSLAVTLQFAGRFVRSSKTLGNATMVANIASPKVEESLRELYAEDADWNAVLRTLSEGATGRQANRSAFLAGFNVAGLQIPLQNVFPKMSTVVYRTKCAEWRPGAVSQFVPDARLYGEPMINRRQQVLLFVTRELEPITWGDIRDLTNTMWDLYLLHWDADQKLLFINSSNNDSMHEDLAKAVAGDDAELIRGERVFRCFHGINRLIFMNMGLNHSVSRAVRFTMYTGADVQAGLAQAQYENRIKSNLFGRGYEHGAKTSIGGAQRGRIWAHKIASDIPEWVDWCRRVGAKLLDESISFDEILKYVLVPDTVDRRPDLVPLAIEWPEAILEAGEDGIEVDFGGERVPFIDVGIEISEHKRDGPLRFRVFTEARSVEYEIAIGRSRVDYRPVGNAGVELVAGRRRRSLSDWLQRQPPWVYFEAGVVMYYNQVFRTQRPRAPFDKGRIETWDWSGVDLTKESQTTAKHQDSIQYHVIRQLLRPEHDPQYDVVFDDDASNEAADVVAIATAGERLIVHLYHCKFSTGHVAGGRVEDLYAVCGQAQRSVGWRGNVEGLLEHLMRRDERRRRLHGVSRFERGDNAKLRELLYRLRTLTPEVKVFVVQPGLSRAAAGASHLDLFAATELYLQETLAVGFGVIASA